LEIGVFELLPVSYLGIAQYLDMNVSCKDVKQDVNIISWVTGSIIYGQRGRTRRMLSVVDTSSVKTRMRMKMEMLCGSISSPSRGDPAGRETLFHVGFALLCYHEDGEG
jgi:hypothetical protein